MTEAITQAAAFGINPASWGIVELAIVFGVVLLVFGPKQLPRLAGSVGKSISGFRKGMKEVGEELEKVQDDLASTIDGDGDADGK